MFRQVLCLAKTGSSFVKRIFRQQGALHEYDFESIAAICIQNNGCGDTDSDRDYINKRRMQLGGLLDVSTSLIFLHERNEINIDNGATLLIVRDPYTWIRSVLQYSIRVQESGELLQEGGWRQQYGRMFTPNAGVLTELVKKKESKETFARIATLDLFNTWIRYTNFLSKVYLQRGDKKVDLAFTHNLSSIECYEEIERLFEFRETVAPLDLFKPANQTSLDSDIDSVLLEQLPGIKDIRIRRKEDLGSAISDAQSLLSEQYGKGVIE